MSCVEAFKKIFNKPAKPVEIFRLTYNCDDPYRIEKYNNPNGYPHPCRTCKTTNTTFQFAITNGIGEPLGSLYYCQRCVPPDIDTVVSHYLMAMGYSN